MILRELAAMNAEQLVISLLKVIGLRYILSILAGAPFLYNFLYLALPYPTEYWMPLTYIIEIALSLAQLVLLIASLRLAIIRFAPDFARRYSLIAAKLVEPSAELNGKRLAQSWITIPLKMSAILIATFTLIPWLIMRLTDNYGETLPYEYFVFHTTHGNVFAGIGAFFALCGWGWGARFANSAHSMVGRAFGVQYLDEDHPLALRVGRMAARLGMKPPLVGTINVNNAFAMGTSTSGATVAIGTPILKTFSQDEIDAIIGHELGHIIANDTVRMEYAAGYQGMFLGAAANMQNLAIHRAKKVSDALLMQFIGWVLQSFIFIFSKMAVMGLSRRREYLADAIGASLTSKDAMGNALRRIHGVAVKPTPIERQYGFLMFSNSGLNLLMSTHPTLDQRLKALEAGHHIRALPRKKPGT